MKTSERKVASNRRNAQKSTGPRSELGRLRSRRNALRHGLAIAIGSDPSFSKDIDSLATTLARGRAGQIVQEFARQVAEAHIDLLRILQQKAASFATVFGNAEPNLEDYSALNKILDQMERYERRAFSRRKRATLAMGVKY
jgi:hypothetical protein